MKVIGELAVAVLPVVSWATGERGPMIHGETCGPSFPVAAANRKIAG